MTEQAQISSQSQLVDRPLLILDLDETLIYSSKDTNGRFDFSVGEYRVVVRRYALEFIRECNKHYDVAIWTSATEPYLQDVLSNLRSSVQFSFAWSRKRCTVQHDREFDERTTLKNLKKVKRKGWDLSRVLIVDDTPAKLKKNYGNAIYVRPFEGIQDDELILLAAYLISIKDTPDFRIIEKRNWRNFAGNESYP